MSKFRHYFGLLPSYSGVDRHGRLFEFLFTVSDLGGLVSFLCATD
jgi:hypothetical protein